MAVAAIIGVVSAAVADGIAGLGNYAAIAGVVALFSLAVAAPTAVLARIWPPLVTVAVLASGYGFDRPRARRFTQ